MFLNKDTQNNSSFSAYVATFSFKGILSRKATFYSEMQLLHYLISKTWALCYQQQLMGGLTASGILWLSLNDYIIGFEKFDQNYIIKDE